MAAAATGHDGANTSANVETPYISQDVQEVAALVRTLEDHDGKKKRAGGDFGVRKTRFRVDGSSDGLSVDSWRFQEWDYKRRDLPTYARGLFTTRTRDGTPEIAIRGYDKFFNIDEVHDTQWVSITARTQGPYEITLKENGCIIFVSGLDDETLLVCSKHSTGARDDVEASHAEAGSQRLDAQLERMGRTRRDLARELRRRNITAVAELCDDSFEEHVLAYGPEKAGLYLHGINLNVPAFATYPSQLVQQFADEWGFIKVGLITKNTIGEVRTFLEGVADTGAYDGQDVEGFVIRCRMSPKPDSLPWHDWFFKYKFEEPYLMYRQWRECTKALISGKTPKYKKHAKITDEYLRYARARLQTNPKLGKLYNQNHGIIALRDGFLAFKEMKGSDAAALEELYGSNDNALVTRDVILVPIATIGCGKTTVGLGLAHLFGWGHVQNDNITGSRRPPRFTAGVLDQLHLLPCVFADRNNAQRHERKQIITDVKAQHGAARLVALSFVHDDIQKIREVTHARVLARGDNHQTIQAARDREKVLGIMEGFIQRFEDCDPERGPDDGFDAIIDLDPIAGSRQNLETAARELHRIFPKLVPTMPSADEFDSAIAKALEDYKPDLRHTIPDRSKTKNNNNNNNNNNNQKQQKQEAKPPKKKPLEYVSVDVPLRTINALLEKTFAEAATTKEQSRFYMQLLQTRRVQGEFHVTLMHRAAAKEHPELWERYTRLQAQAEEASAPGGKMGECDVLLERIVWDDRIMAIVARLLPTTPTDGKSTTTTAQGDGEKGAEEVEWQCANRVAHITVGTRDAGVKPVESNALLARWLDEGTGEASRISDLGFDERPTVRGTVCGVLAR